MPTTDDPFDRDFIFTKEEWSRIEPIFEKFKNELQKTLETASITEPLLTKRINQIKRRGFHVHVLIDASFGFSRVQKRVRIQPRVIRGKVVPNFFTVEDEKLFSGMQISLKPLRKKTITRPS